MKVKITRSGGNVFRDLGLGGKAKRTSGRDQIGARELLPPIRHDADYIQKLPEIRGVNTPKRGKTGKCP